MMDNLARLRKSEREVIEHFLLLGDWRKRISGVVVMTADPADSMARERGQLPVVDDQGRVTGGSIMNEDVLTRFKATVEKTIREFEKSFVVELVNTSQPGLSGNVQKTCEVVAAKVLDWIDAHVQERILTLPRTRIEHAFSGDRSWLDDKGEVETLIQLFLREGTYLPREEVERDPELVQALPIVVIRNKSGYVLRLRRRERDKQNYLHEKLVVWAGGHVREEDATNGDPVVTTAVRELNEELRLRVQKEDLAPIGIGYFLNYGERTAKHVAIAYEWIAKTDDVAVVLSTAEFFERTGSSLSGKFVPASELEKEATDRMEPWSRALIERHVLRGSTKQEGLF
jgi:predicted NUDIX family phosphoesterase